MLDHLAIERILPLRPPFLMVDSVIDYQNRPFPKIRTQCEIRPSELFFSSDSELNELPSVYIIEGLAQSANLLGILISYEKLTYLKSNGDNNNLLSHISSNLDDFNNKVFDGEVNKTLSIIGLLASVEVEISGNVFQGDLIRFEVEQTKVYADMSRFSVNAYVGENEVANGFLIGSEGKRMGVKQ